MNVAPPCYRFALFGLRRSGKSVFLAALNAERRPISDGSTISYVDTAPPYLPGLSEDASELRRRRAKELYLENASGLGLGRVPAETETAEGVTTHHFNLTLAAPPAPGASQIIRIELLDYAGELLKPRSEETEMRDLLHRVLSETDGLVILAETPSSTVQSADGAMVMQPLNELSSALNTLHDQDPQALRCAVLLVTKWDRRHPFDIVRGSDESESDFRARERAEEDRHRAAFDGWLGDEPEAGRLRELDRQLRASFSGGDYKSWPNSAFGVSQLLQVDSADGQPVEISKRPELASLNLVEPLRFLIDRARAQHRRALEALAPDGATPSGDLPSDETVVAEHGEDETLRAHAQALREASQAAEAAAKAKRRTRILTRCGMGIAAALVTIGGGMYGIQASHVSELRKTIEAARQSDDLERVVAAHDLILASADERPILGPVLPASEQGELRAGLAGRECELWGRKAGQGVLDVDQARARQAILPQCEGLDHALAKESERVWHLAVEKAQADLSVIVTETNCTNLGFKVEEMYQAFGTLQDMLSIPPAGVEAEAVAKEGTAERQRADCLTWHDEAKLRSEHEAEEGRSLEQEKWLDFFNRQKRFLGDAQDSDRLQRLQLVGSAMEELDVKIREWIKGDISRASGRLEEMNRLISAIDALKGSHATELGGQLDTLRITVREAIDRLDTAAMCEAVSMVVADYEKMKNDLRARNPAAVTKLREGVDGLKQKDWAIQLVRDIENTWGRIRQITLERVEISGNFPQDFRANQEVSGLLRISGLSIDLEWAKATKQNGFNLRTPVRSLISDDQTLSIRVALGQDKFGPFRGSWFFGGLRSLDRAELFEAMSISDKLDATATLKVRIAQDQRAEMLSDVSVAPTLGTAGTDIELKLTLKASPLPELKEKPSCPAN